MSIIKMSGDDATSTIAYNATKFPGTAYATNKFTLDVFFDLQRQLNRVAYMRKLPTIAEDGLIGGATLVSLKAIIGVTETVSGAAANAALYRGVAKVMATTMSAPLKPPSPPPAAPPAMYNAATNAVIPTRPAGAGASILDTVKNLPPAAMVAIALGAVAAGYYLTKPKRGGV